MPRRTYRPRSRRPQNTVWQCMTWTSVVQVSSGAPGTIVSGKLASAAGDVWTPGLGAPFTDEDVQQFDDQVVLERIRGSMCHNGGGANNLGQTWFPFSLAGIKIPQGFSTPSDVNLFDNREGEDFFLRHDAVCNAGSTAATPNWHELDSKAKRRFDVGDGIAFLFSLIRPAIMGSPTSFAVDLAFNLRFLWRLKN